MKTIEKMTGAQARKRLEELEAERATVVGRMQDIAPPSDARAVHSYGHGDLHRAALEGDDPQEVLELEREFETLQARSRQIDVQLDALRARVEAADTEARIESAPKEIAKCSDRLEAAGARLIELEDELRELKAAAKRDADAVLDLRRLVGLREAPGLTPQALRALWLFRHRGSNGKIVWSGSTGVAREALVRDAVHYLEPPIAEAERLADESVKRHNPHRGHRKNEFERVLLDLQMRRVRAIAEGRFE